MTVDLPAMAAGEELFFVIDVPAGSSELTFELTPAGGATGDTDLYTLFEEFPNDSTYDCRPWTSGTVAETCTYPDETLGLPAPQEGQYFVRIDAWTASTGYTLTATYDGDPPVGDITLTARAAFPLKGQRVRVPLAWDGAEGTEVDIWFNGEVAATVDNTGRFVHTFTAPAPGPGSATYQVCDAGGTTNCSAEVTVNYRAR